MDILDLASPEGDAIFAALDEVLGAGASKGSTGGPSGAPGAASLDALTVATRLRAAGHSPALVAAALTQTKLRRRAEAKFGAAAAQLLFTRDGLEQATRAAVAERHADRFAAAGIRRVLDLGCGIGSDARAVAAAGIEVQAVDADPLTAGVAAYNLRHWPTATVLTARAEDVELPGGEASRHTGVWFDPARRTPGVADVRGRTKRVFSLDQIEPSWEFVLATAAAVPATGAKLSPSLPHGAVPPGAEAQWLSWHGDVVECAVWWGPLVAHVGRTARVCRSGAPDALVTQADLPEEGPPAGGPLADWVYEADRAVVRAGLSAALSTATAGVELDAGLGWAASDRAVAVSWARRYRLIEAMPFHAKRIRAWLRERGIRGATIKVRGLSLHEPTVRRDLGIGTSHGDEALLVLTRHAGAAICLVVEEDGDRSP